MSKEHVTLYEALQGFLGVLRAEGRLWSSATGATAKAFFAR